MLVGKECQTISPCKITGNFPTSLAHNSVFKKSRPYQNFGPIGHNLHSHLFDCVIFQPLTHVNILYTYPVLGQNPPGQNPPGQNPPDKIPLDKIPPRTKSPRTKSPWTKPPGQNPPIIFYIQYPFATQILN